MTRWMRRFAAVWTAFAVLLTMLAVRLLDPGDVLADMRLKVFDYYQRFQPRSYEPADVRIVDLDDETIERIGQWPWPRILVAKLAAALIDAGAAAVAFDIVFSEPDRTSPRRVIELWPQAPELEPLKAAASSLPDHDELLAELIGEAQNVVTGFLLTGGKPGRAPAIKGNFALAGDDPSPLLTRHPGAVTNLPIIEQRAAGNGSFNFTPDKDGIVRRLPLVMCLAREDGSCQFYPSLAAESLRVAQGARTNIIKASGAHRETGFGINTGINNIRIGRIAVPTDSKGQIWLHFTRETARRYVPAWRILAGDFDPALIEGNIVFVGTSAAGLKDLRPSPIHPTMAGVEAHANAVEQILLAHHLQRPDWADGVELLFILVLGGLIVGLLAVAGAGWSAGLTAAAIFSAGAASWYAYTSLRFLLDPVTPSATVLAVYVAGTLLNYIRTEGERAQVRGAFAQYLSPALLDQLARDPSRLALGGETRNMTFLFCDVRGFTTISELFKANPQGLTRLMNRFLTPLTDVIMARQGTIDKYIGDCIMAFWNAPLDDPDHPKHACASALAMLEAIKTLNLDLEAEAKAENRPFFAINVGIGINSGKVVVGNMGSTQRFDYSVLGDAVNLASRLEGQSKTYGVDVILGEATRSAVNDSFAMIELDLIAVKGKEEAVRIYALLGDESLKRDRQFRSFAAAHAEMLSLYRGQIWAEAKAFIADLRRTMPGLSGLYALYSERIAAHEKEPPGANWDGAFRATSK
jgi:adenylate cyclase